jgi:hypothetical protein
MRSGNFLTSAQDSGQLLMFEGKTCSHLGSFTTDFPPFTLKTVEHSRYLPMGSGGACVSVAALSPAVYWWHKQAGSVQ